MKYLSTVTHQRNTASQCYANDSKLDTTELHNQKSK